MRVGMKIAVLTFGLIFIFLNLNAVNGYDFGTKVKSTDGDIGRPLFSMPIGTTIAYWDTGGILGYDEKDVVYLHTPGSWVNANDVRLTSVGAYPPGSKVTMQDKDIGMPLIPFPGASFGYLNLYGSGAYDFQDPVYVHQNAPPILVTILNDVRLTDANSYKAGTKVHDFNQDFNKLFGGWNKPVPIRFFDVDGNGIYDYQDDVYLNIPTGVPGIVSVNNVRISQQSLPNDGRTQTNTTTDKSQLNPEMETTILGIGNS
jgi:hypothetical protein